MKIKRLLLVSMLLSVVCMLCACNGNKNRENADNVTESIDYEALYRAEEINDIINDSWSKSESGKNDSAMLMSEYIANVFIDDFNCKSFDLGYCSDSRCIYALKQYATADESFYRLYSLDGNSKKVTYVRYDAETIGGFIYEPYAVDGRVFAQYIYNDNSSSGELIKYSCIELLKDGTIKAYDDVMDVLRDNDWIPEPHYVPEATLRYETATGHTYVLSPTKDRLIVSDKAGKTIDEIKGTADGGRCQIAFYAMTPDGHIIFLRKENGKETFFTYNENSTDIVYEGESGPEAEGTYQIVDGHGRILFLKNYNTVTCWDTKAGTQEMLYKSSTGAMYYSEIDAFTRNDKGEILILSDNNVRVISYEGSINPVEITIKSLGITGNTIKQCIRRYEETHPGVKITILPDTEWNSRDSELNKVYAEITNGEGPDMLQVWDDQLVHLIKSNCLYDLSNIIKPEVEKALVPAILGEGVIDGKKYRLGMSPEIRTLVINKKYSKEGSLTVKDILDIIEERKNAGNPFERVVAGTYSDNLLDVLLSSISESEFIDMEKSECYFDSESFIRLLKVCKEYIEKNKAEGGYYSGRESIKFLKEDKALLYFEGNMSLCNYSDIFASLGEDYITIGFPVGNNMNKNILSFATGGIVVNSASMQDGDKKRIIEDLLNCMYTPDYIIDTVGYDVPVRIDAFEGRIMDASEYCLPNSPSIKLDRRSYMPIAGKKDGSSFVNEYLELLKSCDNVFSKDAGALKTIVMEETADYFGGSKTAEEVAKIIQGRTELYLMERQ